MKVVQPKDYPKLKPGALVQIVSGKDRTRTPGRLLYAQNYHVRDYDSHGNLTGKSQIRAHRVGFVPVEPQTHLWKEATEEEPEERLQVHEVHISCGQFAIEAKT